jgi:ribokinase
VKRFSAASSTSASAARAPTRPSPPACAARASPWWRASATTFGPATIANFEKLGIDTKHVRITPGVSSGVAPIFVDSAGQNRILVVKGANDRLLPADIDAAADLLRSADCIVLQLEVSVETVWYTLRFARRHGIRSILNPAPGQPLDLAEAANADYVVPNETEAEALSGMPVTNLEEARACAAGLHARGLRGVIVTLGSNGALSGGTHYPPHRVTPVDTTGAGDAFIGSFATFLAGGAPEPEAIAKANVYAALSTLSIGTQMSFVTRERFETAWAG